MSADPYAALGLRRNPFVLDDAPTAAETWVDRGHSAPPPPGARHFRQIIGRKGVGKSSHLRHWQRTQPGPYHYVERALRSRVTMPPLGPVVYWDEVDRVPWPLLWVWLRRGAAMGATIAAGTHADLAWVARRAGYTVETIRLETLDAGTLCHWAAARIAAAALPGATPTIALGPDEAESLVARTGPSLRDAADHLHVWAARAARAKKDAPGPGRAHAVRPYGRREA